MSKIVANTSLLTCRGCNCVKHKGRVVGGQWYCQKCAPIREKYLSYESEDTEY